jgi:hypothetical protein
LQTLTCILQDFTFQVLNRDEAHAREFCCLFCQFIGRLNSSQCIAS